MRPSLTDLWSIFLKHDHSGGARGAAVPGNVPIGTIIMWRGTAASIPSGWALCDGTGGRADLRGKYIRGAGLTYIPGDSGGAATVNIAHSHGAGTLATPSDGAHTHLVSFGAATWQYDLSKGAGFTTNHAAAGHTHPAVTSASNGAHTHAPSGATATDGSTTVSTHPKYRRLYFIQRVS